jgi:hypothetical protein
MKSKLCLFILLFLVTDSSFIFCSETVSKTLTETKSSTEIKNNNQIQTSNENSFSTESKTQARTKFGTTLMSLPKFDVRNINFPKDAAVFWEGWVKFFHYNNGTHYHKPKAFFQNDKFYDQRIHRSEKNNKDKYGLYRIPSQAHFYLVVYKNSLSFYKSRRRIIMNLADNIKIDFIRVVPEDKPFTGGVKDLGDFDEGNCLELSASIPKKILDKPDFFYKGKDQIWVICSDHLNQKNKLFTTLLKLKVRRQRDLGLLATRASIKANRLKIGKSVDKLLKTLPKSKSTKPRDGFWIKLYGWTKCTLSCGGGLSYQQYMCVPPKNDGKPCKGKAIRTRPCNTHKCPKVSETVRKINRKKIKKIENPVKPIIRILPFSTRPQRYSKCLIKETDAYLMKLNNKGIIAAKQPIRLLMNNYTISVYQDDNYQDNLYSFKLDNSRLLLNQKKCCINVKDNYKEMQFCGFESDCGSIRKNTWANSWSKDFNLFKFQCKVGIKLLNPGDLTILGEKMKNKLGALKDDLVAEKQKLVNKKNKKRDVELMSLKIKKTQDMGFKVIEKELNIESLVAQEEKDKEALEMRNLMSKLKKEKKKRSCLDKKIKEKKKEGETIFDKNAQMIELGKIKKEIAKNVEIKRAELKRRIQLMRQRSKRRRAELQQRIQKVRGKMAKDIMLANKKGSSKFCRKGKKNKKERIAYCNANFVEDIVRNTDCKDKDEFCYMCCENEFGDMFIQLREDCYNMCDNKSSKVSNRRPGNNKRRGRGKGKWVWRPRVVADKK